jgi:pyruvate formate lyase activating enzyme
MDRRLFLRCTGCTALAAAASQTGMLPEILGGIKNTYAFDNNTKLSSVEARYYKKLPEGGIECNICPRHCMVTDLERGYCGTRENRDDTYYTLVYGLPCALNIDPIEKKPLYHFYPGTNAFSLATAGCNVNCKFCQNWDISQTRPEQLENYSLSIEEAINVCKTRSVPTIAYTYSEPVIFYEYMYDMAKLGQKNGIRSVMITGGYIDELPLAELIPQLDAIKVDLKSIREDYYREIVDGELKPVLDRLIQIKKAGMWLELVYLIVPTLNDTDAEFKELALWIKENLGVETPLHFSRFFPKYLLTNLPATPPSTMERAYQICKSEGLHYVYLGNLRGNKAESTYCPKCEALLIERRGYQTTLKNIDGDRCKICNHQIPGRFK